MPAPTLPGLDLLVACQPLPLRLRPGEDLRRSSESA
jgi:hypothetical protein